MPLLTGLSPVGRARKRVSVPGVAELLRPAAPVPATSDERQATGRERHDQKITVYLSATELIDLEHARLKLRRFGYVLDRGRLVREAIAVLLADLDARGRDSLIARRIRAGRDEDKDDAVPSLGTSHFLAFRDFGYCAARPEKREVPWARP